MRQPSTEWRERIAPDEETRHARAAQVIANLQKARSAKYGKGRGLHRKQLLAARGTLEIFPDLPEPCRHGLFATAGTHPVLVRLSNGGPDVKADRAPDIRGFAFKVLGTSGEGALGGTTDHQDFLMINQDHMAVVDSREFVEFLEAATPGQLSSVLHLFTAHGLGGGFRRLRGLLAQVGKPFPGFAAERFNTVGPLACGPYAVRVRLAPAGNPPPQARTKEIVADMRERLAAGPLTWTLELQFFVDESITPIEDVSKVWPDAETPIVAVGRLTLPQQGVDPDAEAEAEAARFDPWGGLAAHRPLGEIMRARKATYFESQKGRGAA